MSKALRYKVGNSQFLCHLTLKRLTDILTKVDMSTNSRVPFVRLNVLPCRTMLQIYVSLAVEHMQMNNRMQNLTAIMSMTTCHRSNYVAILVNYRQLLIRIISHNFLFCKTVFLSQTEYQSQE